jgi:phenylpropionate dioxygenase-like ring-hydroxylating dioxygenase large terminal subunit
VTTLNHWHPVLASRELRRKPVGVKVASQPLVLFRTRSGSIGALPDQCLHRRSRLSTGTVVGDRLRCQYHGWTFDAAGCGESPGTPKLTACATAFDVREAYGYVWVKAPGCDAPFPQFDLDGYYRIGELRHRMPAPLELVVDNFTEIEHTTINHQTFGHDLDGVAEVKVTCEATDATATVVSAGPTKRLPLWKAIVLGARPGYDFNSVAETHFSPVYTRFDHWWSAPDGSREGRVRWRLYLFYVPEDDRVTNVVSFMYARSRWPLPRLGLWCARGIYCRETDVEIQRDVALLSNIADQSPDLDGMRLSRFDRILGLTRERIERIYRAGSAQAGHRTPLDVTT